MVRVSEAETYKLTALAENKTLDEVICFRGGAGAYQHYQPHAVKQLMARSEFIRLIHHISRKLVRALYRPF